MLMAALGAARFFWVATRGNRLRPWRSEYLRWRVETYSGKSAGTLRLRDILMLVLVERHQFLRFLGWTGEMRQIARHTTESGKT